MLNEEHQKALTSLPHTKFHQETEANKAVSLAAEAKRLPPNSPSTLPSLRVAAPAMATLGRDWIFRFLLSTVKPRRAY